MLTIARANGSRRQCYDGTVPEPARLTMEFCDVALPVPLDSAFSYRIPDGMQPVVGARVLVPFRQQRLSGIVTGLHRREPAVRTKEVLSILDPAPVLDDQLLRLGRWIADYYLAPLGEVFRAMLPLSAEFKRVIVYRIAEEGRLALHEAGMSGSSARAPRMNSFPRSACSITCPNVRR
jgi:primosomal protein N' (replication factor Y) (superfamily II helicase)